jgi:glycosyltransferase involved in cell wall biosynthesis
MKLQAAGIPTVHHLTTSTDASQLETLSKAVTTVIVVSPSTKALCGASNVVLLENTVPETFCPGPKDPKMSREVPVVLYCGAVGKPKGTDILIPAVRGLACELWLVGSVAPTFQAKSENAVFWGTQCDTVPFYRSADLFVLPSRSEGMSMALLEAMATGLPCIASDIQANRDTLRGAGILCGLTPGELRTAVAGLLDSKARREQLGEEALRVAQTRRFSEWCNSVVTTLEKAACLS